MSTATIEESVEDPVTVEGSLEDYLDRIHQLERALFLFVIAAHRDGVCGVDGVHREECAALFEQLGWEGYEEYMSAMSPIVRPRYLPGELAKQLPEDVRRGISTGRSSQ